MKVPVCEREGCNVLVKRSRNKGKPWRRFCSVVCTNKGRKHSLAKRKKMGVKGGNIPWNKGGSFSEESKEKMRESALDRGDCVTVEAKRKLSYLQSVRVSRGLVSGRCAYYIVNGLTCQGTSEKQYIETLIREGKELPTKARPVNTPYGYYVPDFEFEDRYIEIKSKWTYQQFLGSRQEKKLNWVSENKKFVELIIIG